MRALLPIVLAFHAACSRGEEGAGDDCSDPACREELISALWVSDPAAAAARIQEVDDPIERIVIVDRLLKEHPRPTQQLCRTLPPGDASAWCRRLNSRPHLWKQAQLTAPDAAQKSREEGPAAGLMTTDVPAPVVELLPRPEACPVDASATRCLTQLARESAARGDQAAAASACGAVDSGIWQDECYFMAAEEFLLVRGADGYASAADFCLLAGSFRAQCLGHTTSWLLREPNRDSFSDPEFVAQLVATADRIAELWATRDPRYGEYAVQRYWSMVCSRAFDESNPVTGDLLDLLPPSVTPFVIAAAARTLAAQMPRDATLSERVSALQDALARRGTVAERPSSRVVVGHADLWVEDAAGDESMPAIVYAESSRRTTSEDQSVDRVIATLEAVARTRPPMLDVLGEARGHPDPQVQWTAARLLRSLATQ